MFIKICGITEFEDAQAAVEAGADALGFNFWRPGKRYVNPDRAADIVERLGASAVWKAAVFVDEDLDELRNTMRLAGLDTVQLHGSETPAYADSITGCRKLKAFRVDAGFSAGALAGYRVDAFLLDGAGITPGGTGATFEWQQAREAARFGRIVLAGGLTPDNVAAAVRAARPWGVDAASGVERSPGRKDARLVRRFIEAAREAEQE